MITLVHKAINEPAWSLSGEGSHTNAESQAEAAPGNFSPPGYTSARRSQPQSLQRIALVGQSKQGKQHFLDSHASLRSDRKVGQGLEADSSIASLSRAYDVPFGAASLNGPAVSPWSLRQAIVDHSVEQAAIHMLIKACQGQLPQDQKLLDLHQGSHEATESYKAAADNSHEGRQLYVPAECRPTARSELMKHVLSDDNQPAPKRQKLWAEELPDQRRIKAEAIQVSYHSVNKAEGHL